MNDIFIQQLFYRQQNRDPVPSNDLIKSWALQLMEILFPERSGINYSSEKQMKDQMDKVIVNLFDILKSTKVCNCCNHKKIVDDFYEQLPSIYQLLLTDIDAITKGDPAAHHTFEVIRAYPGFYAIFFYRIAHILHELGVPLLPRILTEIAHSQTGIDIHPAAIIGSSFCIDHGTGIVIGETAIIGNHVKLFQGVTLGALSVSKNMAGIKRHPTVEDHVIIYSGATILGGETIIGRKSIIGGNVWLTQSVPAGSLVSHQPEITVLEGKLLISTIDKL